MAGALGRLAAAFGGSKSTAQELIGSKLTSQDTAGMIRQVLVALEKPIYSDVTTTSTTYRTRGTPGNPDGNLVTKTETKGWTIPLGLPVLFVGSIAAWEAASWFAQALNKSGLPLQGVNVVELMSPITWVPWDLPIVVSQDEAGAIVSGVNGAFAGLLPFLKPQVKSLPSGQATVTIRLPPTFMAAMATLGVQGFTPLIALMNRVLGLQAPQS